MLRKLIDETNHILSDVAQKLYETVDKLGIPSIYPLDKREIFNVCAAVAVDAGQTLFSGAFRDIGVTVFQVASSDEKETPIPYVFWAGTDLPDDKRKEGICYQLSNLIEEDKMVSAFINKMGWNDLCDPGVMPPSCFSSSSEFASFLRDLLEWAKLYDSGLKLKKIADIAPMQNIRPVLLRDGTLRLAHTGEQHSNKLRGIFKNMGVPVIGITKASELLRSPAFRYWLVKHDVFNREKPFVIKVEAEMFRALNWKQDRYFENDIRFGEYVIARFDPMPGSQNIFAVDVPDYLMTDWDKVLVLLSGICQHTASTAYPVPGYPLVLRKAHDKAVLSEERVSLFESVFKRSLPPDIFNLLKGFTTITMRR